MVLHGLCDAWRTGSPAPGLRALGVFLPAQRVFLLLLLLPVTPLMALFLAPFVAVSAEADIHRCRSSEGEVSYTDLHCPDGVLILEADASTPASRSTATGGLSKQSEPVPWQDRFWSEFLLLGAGVML